VRASKASRPAAAVSANGPHGSFDRLGDRITAEATQDRPNNQTDAVLSGQRFGAWTAIKPDPTGKRISCVCACGTARQVAVDALFSGDSLGCGCAHTPRPKTFLSTTAPTKFSAKLAALEERASAGWHKGRGRSP
jgi:hypothetical protein